MHSVFIEQQSSESLNNLSNPGDANFLNGDMVMFTESREVEPARFNNTNLAATLVTPDIGWYMNFGRFTVASGLYGSSGGGVNWQDEISNTTGTDTIQAEIDLYFLLNRSTTAYRDHMLCVFIVESWLQCPTVRPYNTIVPLRSIQTIL